MLKCKYYRKMDADTTLRDEDIYPIPMDEDTGDTDLILHINEEEERLEEEQCLSWSIMQPKSRDAKLPLFDQGDQSHNDSDKVPTPENQTPSTSYLPPPVPKRFKVTKEESSQTYIPNFIPEKVYYKPRKTERFLPTLPLAHFICPFCNQQIQKKIQALKIHINQCPKYFKEMEDSVQINLFIAEPKNGKVPIIEIEEKNEDEVTIIEPEKDKQTSIKKGKQQQLRELYQEMKEKITKKVQLNEKDLTSKEALYLKCKYQRKEIIRGATNLGNDNILISPTEFKTPPLFDLGVVKVIRHKQNKSQDFTVNTDRFFQTLKSFSKETMDFIKDNPEEYSFLEVEQNLNLCYKKLLILCSSAWSTVFHNRIDAPVFKPVWGGKNTANYRNPQDYEVTVKATCIAGARDLLDSFEIRDWKQKKGSLQAMKQKKRNLKKQDSAQAKEFKETIKNLKKDKKNLESRIKSKKNLFQEISQLKKGIQNRDELIKTMKKTDAINKKIMTTLNNKVMYPTKELELSIADFIVMEEGPKAEESGGDSSSSSSSSNSSSSSSESDCSDTEQDCPKSME